MGCSKPAEEEVKAPKKWKRSAKEGEQERVKRQLFRARPVAVRRPFLGRRPILGRPLAGARRPLVVVRRPVFGIRRPVIIRGKRSVKEKIAHVLGAIKDKVAGKKAKKVSAKAAVKANKTKVECHQEETEVCAPVWKNVCHD